MPDSPLHRFDRKRYALSALILLLSALAAYPLCLQLISQIHYQRGMNFIQQDYYGLASQALRKAATYQPKDYRIHRQWANAVYKLGELNPSVKGAYDLADKAKLRELALRHGLEPVCSRHLGVLPILSRKRPLLPKTLIRAVEKWAQNRPGTARHAGFKIYVFRHAAGSA